ncbi:MAG: hypothetical protein OXG44_10510 [Gammaproteobacteria bacterium]|nr:hypothetical protein [Gammaproteobacteria bacterium]
MPDWASLVARAQDRKRQNAYNAAVAGIDAATGTPEYTGRLARVAAEHGMATPGAVAQMSELARAGQQQEHMNRLKLGAPLFMAALDRLDRGDQAAAGDLDSLMQQYGDDLGRYLKLPRHRRIEGMDIAAPEGGEAMLAPRIANAQTGTTGPMTYRGTADGGDRVVARSSGQLRPFFSHLMGEPRSGKWNTIKMQDGQVLMWDEGTGRQRIVGQAPDGKGSGSGPKLTDLGDGRVAWLNDKGELQTANVQTDEQYFNLIAQTAGNMAPLNVEAAAAATADLRSNRQFQDTLASQGLDFDEDRARAIVADLSRNKDEDFVGASQRDRRNAVMARYFDVPLPKDLSAADWVAGLGATAWNQFSDLSTAAEGIAGIYTAMGGSKEEAEKVKEIVRAGGTPTSEPEGFVERAGRVVEEYAPSLARAAGAVTEPITRMMSDEPAAGPLSQRLESAGASVKNRMYQDGSRLLSLAQDEASGTFDRALQGVLDVEGGYVNNPADRGGETNHGITERIARQHGYRGDMRRLSQERAKRIYRDLFWQPLGLDRLSQESPATATAVFNTAVQSGADQARQFLANAEGATDRERAASVLEQQRAHYASIVRNDPTQGQFLPGWLSRSDQISELLDTLQ